MLSETILKVKPIYKSVKRLQNLSLGDIFLQRRFLRLQLKASTEMLVLTEENNCSTHLENKKNQTTQYQMFHQCVGTAQWQFKNIATKIN